jgi:hypothetical protein
LKSKNNEHRNKWNETAVSTRNISILEVVERRGGIGRRGKKNNIKNDIKIEGAGRAWKQRKESHKEGRELQSSMEEEQTQDPGPRTQE